MAVQLLRSAALLADQLFILVKYKIHATINLQKLSNLLETNTTA